MISFLQYVLKYKMKCLKISALNSEIIGVILSFSCFLVLSDLLLTMNLCNFTIKYSTIKHLKIVISIICSPRRGKGKRRLNRWKC